MSEITLQVDEIGFRELFDLHKICDKDFDPPLSSRTDIEAYCQKLIRNAEILSVSFKGILAGVLCIYTNDALRKTAYVSSVVIKREHRRLGLGDLLVRKAISLSEEKKMALIRLEVGRNNLAAQKLYRKHGFELESETAHTFMMTREINGE